MFKEIIKKGLPFGLVMGIFQALLDCVEDKETAIFLLKKHALISLIFGLGFGVIVTYFNRRNEAKEKN